MDAFQLLFLSGSVLLMLVQSIRGWRLGVVRQLVNLVALVAAYGTAMPGFGAWRRRCCIGWGIRICWWCR